MTTLVRTFEVGPDGYPLVHGPGWMGENNCYIHGYEPVPEHYFVCCGECGHIYATAEDLRCAYRRIIEQMAIRSHHEMILGCSFDDGLHAEIDPLVMPSAEEIGFCQECTHDF